LNNLIKNIYLNGHIILLSLIFYGLSIGILLKEINLIFLPSVDLHILHIYRFLIVIICIFAFFTLEKKFSKNGFILILINFLFLVSTIFTEELRFSIDGMEYLRNYNTSPNSRDIFFSSKTKVLIINFFNIILPIIFLLFLRVKKFDLNKYKNISLKICDINLIILLSLLIFKYFYINFFSQEKNIEWHLINIHSLLYILNIHFLLIVDQYFLKKEISKTNIIKIFGIFVCFSITKSYVFVLICITSYIIYFVVFSYQLKKLIYLISSICLIIIVYVYYEYLSYNQTFKFVIYEPGTILNSIFIRIKNIEYYLYYSENLNLIFGNNIFSEQAATYPHNFFVDLIFCTGIFGTLLFLFLIYLLLKNIKKINLENIFFFIIFFQSLFFSIFSGFLFTNMVFNISLATLFCLIGEKEEKMSKNSRG